jgi:hypothetical protein
VVGDSAIRDSWGLQYLEILLAMSRPNRRNCHIVKCAAAFAIRSSLFFAMISLRLKVKELLSELISQLEIPCEQDEEVTEAALPPSEAHWVGTFDSGLEEDRPGCSHDFDEYPEMKNRYCAITTMASQQDVPEQRGRS